MARHETTPTDRRVIAGALALALGVACLFATFATQAEEVVTMALALAAVALLAAGTVTVGVDDPRESV